MKIRKKKEIMLFKRAIFFLDVFLALLIITSASFLIKTTFGRTSLIFGFFMLVVTTLLKIVREW